MSSASMEELLKDFIDSDTLEELNDINFSNKKLTLIESKVLNKCANVTTLNLSKNRLKSLSGICLPKLEVLNFEDNSVADITFLADVPTIKNLFMDGNPLNLADRFIAVDLLQKLEMLDGKSCADTRQQLQQFETQLAAEANRIYLSKYRLAVESSSDFNELVQQRRLFQREVMNKVPHLQGVPPKFHRYKVQNFIETFFKSSQQTPKKMNKEESALISSPTSVRKRFSNLQLSSPAPSKKINTRNSTLSPSTPKRNLLNSVSSPSTPERIAVKSPSMSRVARRSLTDSAFSPRSSRRNLENSLTSPSSAMRNLMISSPPTSKQVRDIHLSTPAMALKKQNGLKATRHGTRTNRSRRQLHTENVSPATTIGYEPQMFLRCHVPDNDPQDSGTQVWAAAFEINVADESKPTDVVATCGRNIVCFINCCTGHVVKRYKCDSDNEDLFSLDWSVLPSGQGKQNTSIVATGGLEKKIYLIHPSQLKCYYVFKAHLKTINCVKFHPIERTWLFSGAEDCCVNVWDIGEISLSDYSNSHKKLMTFGADHQIVQMVISKHHNSLFAAADKYIAVWDLCKEHKQWKKKPSVILQVPENCASEEKRGVVDGLALISDTYLAFKESLSGKIAVWNTNSMFPNGEITKTKNLEISAVAIFLWSDSDSDFNYIGSCKDAGLMACGDNAGRLWLYDVREYQSKRSKSDVPACDLSLPALVLPWPHLNFENENLAMRSNVIVNSVAFSKNGEYMIACTNSNLVCIWKKK